MVLEEVSLQFFPTSEGYVKPNPNIYDPTKFNYVYNYTDHLGNVRLSFQDVNNNGRIDEGRINTYLGGGQYCYNGTSYPQNYCQQTSASEILEENNYYPFGLKHKGYNDGLVQGSYKYKYQGQERQDELGLNWDSFKWRNYDYTIGRFMSIDPLSEKYNTWAPYVFSGNRVID